jgi:hypothetical protein
MSRTFLKMLHSQYVTGIDGQVKMILKIIMDISDLKLVKNCLEREMSTYHKIKSFEGKGFSGRG